MASFIFKKLPSATRQRRYSFELSREGRGLLRKAPLTAEQMMELHELPPNTFPSGTDMKVPRLPGDR